MEFLDNFREKRVQNKPEIVYGFFNKRWVNNNKDIIALNIQKSFDDKKEILINVFRDAIQSVMRKLETNPIFYKQVRSSNNDTSNFFISDKKMKKIIHNYDISLLQLLSDTDIYIFKQNINYNEYINKPFLDTKFDDVIVLLSKYILDKFEKDYNEIFTKCLKYELDKAIDTKYKNSEISYNLFCSIFKNNDLFEDLWLYAAKNNSFFANKGQLKNSFVNFNYLGINLNMSYWLFIRHGYLATATIPAKDMFFEENL